MDLRDYFENTWTARGKLLNAFQTLTPEEWAREFDFSWKSTQKLFAHVVEVERSWVTEDILGTELGRLSEQDVRRVYGTVESARARSHEITAETRQVLAEYVPARLAETRMGKDIDGNMVRFTVEQILTHVFTHELRHQGQLQAMLRLLGKPAPNADWI